MMQPMPAVVIPIRIFRPVDRPSREGRKVTDPCGGVNRKLHACPGAFCGNGGGPVQCKRGGSDVRFLVSASPSSELVNLNHTETPGLLASVRIRGSLRRVLHNEANFGFGTLVEWI